MKDSAAVDALEKLKNTWFWIKIIEHSLLALSVGAWFFLLMHLFSTNPQVIWSASIAFLCLSFSILFYFNGLHTLNNQRIARYLNQQIPGLESSTDLLLQDNHSLGFLARLQKDKIAKILTDLKNEIHIPQHLWQYGLGLIFSVVCCFYLLDFVQKNTRNFSVLKTKEAPYTQPETKSILPVGVQSGTVRIEAPGYTGIAAIESKNLNIRAATQSKLSWQFTFTGSIQTVYLAFSTKDTLRLVHQGNGVYATEAILQKSGFYALHFKSEGQALHSSDYYSVEAIADKKPMIKVNNLDEYTDLQFNPHLIVQLEANISDDYGLTDAFIITTISRGKGESVKFKEEKIPFDNSLAAGTQSAQLHKKFKLSDLGMRPGDELYFYIEAQDNKQPIAQKNRSDVHFIALADTSLQSMSMQLGNGVNQMPEYFRSQRQLIIDTEKLIAEEAQLTAEKFQSKSNDIGVDQKILRLRYGQFLGEEFESSIGHSHDEKEETHSEGDGHDHMDEGHKKWKEETSSIKVLEKNEQSHNQKTTEKGIYQGVPESVMHIHDVQEEMSFLDESLKAELRVVLNQMWESELRLRTNRPQESLPFQYKALYLLKDIQQKSRVYVERVGFDPPKVDEKGKRLTGDIQKIKDKLQKREYTAEMPYPSLKQLLIYLEKLKDFSNLPTLDKALFYSAGLELAQIAIEKPGLSLKSLKIIKQITEGQLTQGEIKQDIPYLIQTIWLVIPQDQAQPSVSSGKTETLRKMFLKKIGT